MVWSMQLFTIITVYMIGLLFFTLKRTQLLEYLTNNKGLHVFRNALLLSALAYSIPLVANALTDMPKLVPQLATSMFATAALVFLTQSSVKRFNLDTITHVAYITAMVCGILSVLISPYVALIVQMLVVTAILLQTMKSRGLLTYIAPTFALAIFCHTTVILDTIPLPRIPLLLLSALLYTYLAWKMGRWDK